MWFWSADSVEQELFEMILQTESKIFVSKVYLKSLC